MNSQIELDLKEVAKIGASITETITELGKLVRLAKRLNSRINASATLAVETNLVHAVVMEDGRFENAIREALTAAGALHSDAPAALQPRKLSAVTDCLARRADRISAHLPVGGSDAGTGLR